MTTSEPRYQDPRPGPSLPPPVHWPPQYGQLPRLAPPPRSGRSAQLVPPPQFGRLPHAKGPGEPPPAQPHRAQPHGGQPADSPATPDAGAPLADFGARTISFLIDVVAPVIVLNLLLAIGVATGSMASSRVLTVAGYLGLISFGIWNSGYLQGTTGQSLGRRVAKTALVRIGTGQPVGFGRAVTRQLCHVLEFGIGYLRPLWDSHRQTVADKITGTVVIRSAGQPDNGPHG